MEIDIDNFNEEVDDCIERIRKWDNLTILEKLARKERKPSGFDYRMVNTWIKYMDEELKKCVLGGDNE